MKPRHGREGKWTGRAARTAGPPPKSAGTLPAPALPEPALPEPAPPAPALPAWRDPWAWACALAVIPIVLHSLGAPLGEPVAEDFDFLHRALFSRTLTLLDGGGSDAFWRPLAHQVYYRTLAPLIMNHPGMLAALHIVLLALASVLLYRAFRSAWPPAWAATIATFPLLSESTRTLISWPSHFVDLGVWLFTAVVIHETAARRLWSALAALLAALLCKEVALVAAILVPWLPGMGPRDRRDRLRWAAAMGALAIAWGAMYMLVRQRAGLHLPHELETSAATVGTPLALRVAWAAGNSLRAYLSLPLTHVSREGPLAATAAALATLALSLALSSAWKRRVLSRSHTLIAWGLAWFLAASATMAPIFPLWAPNRSGYASLGLGALAATLFGVAHSGLLASLVALRIVAFALSPAPPATVAPAAPETGAFLDFERLARLQRLMRDTRRALETRHPTLPAHAGVGLYHLPRDAEYSYGGSRSLQVWYRDSTLYWVRHSEFLSHPNTPMTAIAEFEPWHRPQIALVPPQAMRALIRAMDEILRKQWEEALACLDRADSLTRNPDAVLFTAQVAGNRAIAHAALGSSGEAEREARHGIALWQENTYAHYALGIVEYRRGNLSEASKHADIILQLMPNHRGAKQLAGLILEASRRAADSLGTPQP